jgi:hypothetical protein
MKTETITLHLPSNEALALAQFVKRAGFSDFRTNAVDDDEAREMISACEKLAKALAEAGYAPR